MESLNVQSCFTGIPGNILQYYLVRESTIKYHSSLKKVETINYSIINVENFYMERTQVVDLVHLKSFVILILQYSQ